MLQEVISVAHTYWQQFLYVLPRLLAAAALMAAVWVGAARLRTWLAAKIAPHATDPLLVNFLTEVGRWLLVGLGLILALNILGLSELVGGMLAGLGLSAFVVGFAFKDIAENFLASILLAFNRPFGINDTIQVKDMFGRVLQLNLRTTVILTFDGRNISVPNAIVLKESLINFTQNGFIRQEFTVGIDYANDAGRALELLTTVMQQEPDVYQGEGRMPFAVVDTLATSTVNLKAFFWTTTETYRKGVSILRGRVINAGKEKLLAEGFSLPADIVELQFPAAPVQVATVPPVPAAAPAPAAPATAAAGQPAP